MNTFNTEKNGNGNGNGKGNDNGIDIILRITYPQAAAHPRASLLRAVKPSPCGRFLAPRLLLRTLVRVGRLARFASLPDACYELETEGLNFLLCQSGEPIRRARRELLPKEKRARTDTQTTHMDVHAQMEAACEREDNGTENQPFL